MLSRSTSAVCIGSLLLLAGLLPVASVHAETIAPGVAYAGGTRLEVPEYGVSFTVPTGWQGILPPDAELFLMQLGAGEAYLLASADQGAESDVVALLSAPIDLGDGVRLLPRTKPEVGDDVFRVRFDVEGAPQPLQAYGEAVVSGYGIAVGYLLVTTAERLEELRAVVTAVREGTTLGAPATTPSELEPTGAQDSWSAYLKGRHLVRFYTATGYTEEEHIWLCSDGSFQRSAAGGGFGGGTPGASGAALSRGDGGWQASGAGASGSLVLRYPDGSAATYELGYDYDSSKLYLDGKRWFRDQNERCN